MTSLARLFSSLIVLALPLATACGTIQHTVGTDDGGTGTGPGTGSCTGTNPGCCGIGSDGCEGIVGSATCEDGAWKCATNESVGPACDAICEASDGGPGPSDGGACVPPVVNAACNRGDIPCSTPGIPVTGSNGQPCEEYQGWSCDNGGGTYAWSFSGIIQCPTPDAGADGGECSGSNPGCCGLNDAGCEAIVEQATCEDGTWSCPSGDNVGPACDGLCLVSADAGPPDAGATLLCGSLFCDGATQYCSEVENTMSGESSCELIPAGCANDAAGAASECECIAEQVANGAKCTFTSSGFTVTQGS